MPHGPLEVTPREPEEVAGDRASHAAVRVGEVLFRGEQVVRQVYDVHAVGRTRTRTVQPACGVAVVLGELVDDRLLVYGSVLVVGARLRGSELRLEDEERAASSLAELQHEVRLTGGPSRPRCDDEFARVTGHAGRLEHRPTVESPRPSEERDRVVGPPCDEVREHSRERILGHARLPQ